MKTAKKLWIGLFVLMLLSPLGLILPAKFCAGSAWGEWSSEEIHKMVGYTPSGMRGISDKFQSPIPDYAFKGQEKAPVSTLSFSYIVSAIVGVGIVVGITILIGKAIAKRERSDAS